MQWQTVLYLPKLFSLVDSQTVTRNEQSVTVERYQAERGITPNNQHITVILDHYNQLVSYNNSAFIAQGAIPDRDEATSIALHTFEILMSEYKKEMNLIKVEYQKRGYIDLSGHVIEVPVLWVKFAHQNGSFGWATVGPNAQIIELERDALWSTINGERETEMWNDDTWVLARKK